MIDDLDELGKLADADLAGAWANIGGHGGEVGGSPECPFVATGLPAAFFNGVYATGPVANPDQLIADATTFMAQRGVPWLLWVREGVDDALLDASRRAGLTGRPPARDDASRDPRESSPSRWPRDHRRPRRRRTRGRSRPRRRGFEMPREFVDVVAAGSMLDDPTVVMVTGSVNGVPVSTALVGVTGNTAGIYNVATPPEHRRRGYGEAVTWAAVAEGHRLGCDHSVLQASPMGAPVYRRMGYLDLGTYVQLAYEPTT